MKLRCRQSEYQRRFASPSKEYFQTVYEEQLTYRLKRREEESGHHALRWDSESSEENSETEKKREETNCKEEVCERLTIPVTENGESIETSLVVVTRETEKPEQDNIRDTRSESNTSSKRKKICSKKPRSRSRSCEHPPFISYGWADQQHEMGRQRTHNIKAPKKAVYPAALKRLNYINAERKKQKDLSESRASTPAAVPVYQTNPSDTSSWMSEYQRCYSSQSARPKTAPSRKKKSTKSRKLPASRGLPR